MMKKLFSKQNKALLSEMVRTDFKLRYQGSILGYTWSLLRPLLLFLVLYVVFVKFLRVGADVPNYPIYLLLGIVIWSFFTEMTSQSLGSIVARGDLIRKIRIPRWLIIVSTSVSALINLVLNLIVVLVFALVTNMDLLISSVWLPILLVEAYIFALGISLLLSALFVRYRDIGYVWEVVLQAGFYVTPILYPLSLITDQTAQKIIMINPMAQIIQDSRAVFVTKETLTTTEVFGSVGSRIVPVVIVVIFLATGVLVFRREAKNFAENV